MLTNLLRDLFRRVNRYQTYIIAAYTRPSIRVTQPPCENFCRLAARKEPSIVRYVRKTNATSHLLYRLIYNQAVIRKVVINMVMVTESPNAATILSDF